MKNNGFPSGEKWNFECECWPTPAPFGIHLNTVTLSPSIGPETVLILREERKFMMELKEHGPFSLNIKSGAIRTCAGPIIFMIWWFGPTISGTPYAAYELLISPSPATGISQVLQNASEQSHLHLLILDEQHEVFDVVEFENVYGLGSLLNAAHQIGAQLTEYDFDRAKEAFNEEFSLDRLLRL